MNVSEKPDYNLTDYKQFLFKKDFNAMKRDIISREKKMKNSGN